MAGLLRRLRGEPALASARSRLPATAAGAIALIALIALIAMLGVAGWLAFGGDGAGEGRAAVPPPCDVPARPPAGLRPRSPRIPRARRPSKAGSFSFA